jgi:hypothetical protein
LIFAVPFSHYCKGHRCHSRLHRALGRGCIQSITGSLV